ncbi:hypothetical protein Hanom_Chr14g01252221 [Helianthus anomalus]
MDSEASNLSCSEESKHIEMVPAVLNNRRIWQKYVKLSFLKRLFENKWAIVRRGAPAASNAVVRVVLVCRFIPNLALLIKPNLHFFNQPMHPNFGYDSQPHQNWMLHGPMMVRPGVYDYPLDAQNSFDPFVFQTPRSQSSRDIQDDSEEEFVSDTQEQHYDEDGDVAVQENPVNQTEAAKERRGKTKRENWASNQEEALVKAYIAL